jgi:hypothetical protein
VFGYPNQKDQENDYNAGVPWARDGSFLVFRRLKQDVGAFHTFLHTFAPAEPALLAAKCVGRWPSGTPILDDAEGKKEKAAIARKEFISNDFTFEGDPEGKVCPVAAHIRKVYPRDGDQTHRLLRRGIPYGEPSFSSPTAPYCDKVDRGLLFLAYQTSIVDQFEHLQKQANNPELDKKEIGYDPIIGQNKDSNPRTFNAGQLDPLKLPERAWVTPTGGGYFFAPSIEALQMLGETSDSITREKYFSGLLDEARKLLEKREREKGQSEVITPQEWAEIWIQAWLANDPKVEEDLKRDPAAAAKKFRKARHRPDPDKYFDMEGVIYKKPFDRGPFEGIAFNRMSPHDLKEIAEKGTLHGKPFCIQPAEFID